ncbi:hypothetical protein [Thermococcus sp. M36]|uniref:hypothetical protein n=1 Tax=Thermococcus sp. M36 TaxID=1638261 RepID=UPI00143BC557|nr:hypothetical protein [Thermococcus sp. M36]
MGINVKVNTALFFIPLIPWLLRWLKYGKEASDSLFTALISTPQNHSIMESGRRLKNIL